MNIHHALLCSGCMSARSERHQYLHIPSVGVVAWLFRTGRGDNEWHWQAMCCRTRPVWGTLGWSLIADVCLIAVGLDFPDVSLSPLSLPARKEPCHQGAQSLHLISGLISVNHGTFHSPVCPADSRTGWQAGWGAPVVTQENKASKRGGEREQLKRADKRGWIRSMCTGGVKVCARISVEQLCGNRWTELLPKLSCLTNVMSYLQKRRILSTDVLYLRSLICRRGL